MSDQELDNLFKEAAEGFKAPSDQSAWSDMASRLDHAGTAAPSFWNWKTVSSSVVVGIAVLSLIWFYASKDIQSAPEKSLALRSDVSTVVQDKITDSAKPVIDKNTDQEISKEKSETIQVQSRNQEPSINKQQIKNEPVQAPILVQPEKVRGAKVKRDAGTLKTEKKNSLSGRLSESHNQANIASTEIAKISNATEVVKQAEQHEQNSKQLSADFSSQSTDNENPLAQSDSSDKEEKKILLDSADSDETPQKQNENKKSRGAISLKVAVAPDFSSVKYFDTGKPGINYGMLVGYVFNNRWSVYSGVISSRKIYSSTRINESYTNSGGYDYPIKKLDGDCRILDIPLNVYYTFFPERSLSIKAGIGFSSYIMLKEDYTYHVVNPYGSNVYDQNIRRENNDWFKVMNVSIILQKKVSNRLSIEFEPFLKAPLAGVGEGEVSLVSLGAFLNVMYNIPLQKNEKEKE